MGMWVCGSGLHPKRLHRSVELRTQFQQLLALVTGNADALQVFVAQYMNALAVVANLAHRSGLLGGDVGDAYGGSGDGGNRVDNFIQRTVGILCLLGGGLGVADLCADAFN